ncbi:MAG: TylF/MycF family methyltransferase [Microscillaceae bacterium]|nr:TylF/MycF family methyltransferase [Microscillaceae bacterium]MDW8461896.1 TylF/MycF/NovP-related O-methyltransferase [Cytophagales bacterium]
MLKKAALKMLNYLGYEVSKRGVPPTTGLESSFLEIYQKCKPYTMTTLERMYATYKATEYVVLNQIAGDFVECGVWRGGSCMMIAYTLQFLGETNRKIWLYDTFEGMPVPSEKDKNFRNQLAKFQWAKSQRQGHNDWCYASLEEVEKNLRQTNYPFHLFKLVKGKVEDTIPQITPDQIALLRLDTDWYESTYHEMKYLYPLVSHKGVLMVDDYGHWEGAKQAIDQYFAENQAFPFLHRIDYTGRVAIKC